MKQYRLLKDFPHVKAGTILPHLNAGLYGIDDEVVFHEDFMKEYPDWFEEVIEQKMKKYKLLKDFLNNKAGDIVELPENMWFSPDWFEEVKPFEWTDELVKKAIQFYVRHEKNKPLMDIIKEFKQREAQYNTDLEQFAVRESRIVGKNAV